MTEYLTEQEQIELLKNWIKQYSLVILAGVAIAIIGMTSWHYWQQRESNMLNHASAIYDEMLTMRAQNSAAATVIQAQKLFTHYPKTTYAQMAAFMLARDAVVKKNYADASEKLNWVLDHSSDHSLRQIARIRLARVMIADHKPEESLKVLQKIEDKSFNGLIDEVRGDAYFAQQNYVLARQSYAHALTELPNAEIIRPLLQMKYDNLNTSN